MRRRAPFLALAVGLSGAVAAGCGIPQDDGPQLIAKESLPVLEPSTTRPSAETRPAFIFFVRTRTGETSQDVLDRVSVRVPASSDVAAFPRSVLEVLVKGPSAEQTDQNLTTDIPPSATIREARIDSNDPSTLVVNIENLGRVEGDKQTVAAAQIVFTATELPGILKVRFLVDGQEAAINTERGNAEKGEAIGRDLFPRLKRALDGAGSVLPEGGSSTTTSSEAPTVAIDPQTADPSAPPSTEPTATP